MASTDPLADLLVSLKNASQARLDLVRVPNSKYKQSVLKVLQAEGFVKSFRTSGRNLEVQVGYGPKRERLLNGVKRISRPGRRVYAGVDGIKPFLRRLEVLVVSTPLGVLTGTQAFARKTGGELLCLLW
jgi:small subunit ribosomal protein S8